MPYGVVKHVAMQHGASPSFLFTAPFLEGLLRCFVPVLAGFGDRGVPPSRPRRHLLLGKGGRAFLCRSIRGTSRPLVMSRAGYGVSSIGSGTALRRRIPIAIPRVPFHLPPQAGCSNGGLVVVAGGGDCTVHHRPFSLFWGNLPTYGASPAAHPHSMLSLPRQVLWNRPQPEEMLRAAVWITH